MSHSPQAMTAGAALILALLAAAPPWAHAQDEAGGEVAALAEELRLLREGVEESNRVDWALFAVSLTVGAVITAAAVWGSVRNARQVERHVSLTERHVSLTAADMSARMRPMLRWTSDGNRLVYPPRVLEGAMIVIRLLNAGQAAAVGIVCDVRFGMEGDLEAGRAGHRRDQWGSLAPNSAIHLNVHVTEEQRLRARGKREKFRVEVKAEYRGPDGREYKYSMGGDYDGREALLHD